MRKSYITYFEPFGGRNVNSSKEIVESLNTRFEKICLPVSWKRVLPILNKLIDDEPEYIFMVGEAGNYQNVTVELMAKNICSGTDEDGIKKDKDRILKATPKEIKTNFNIEGLNLLTSNDAGKFLCNYVYYICLLRSEITKVIFIHVPYLHPKGSRKKSNVLKKVENAINLLIQYDDNYLLRIKGKPFKLNEENAYDFYPELQREYGLPNIIIGLERNEDGSFIMSGRADGYKGTWYDYGNSKEDENKCRKSIYYQIACFQHRFDKTDREEDSLYIQKTKRFDEKEYVGSEKLLKRYINLFLSRADYSDEFNFYVSLDRIMDSLNKSVIDKEEDLAIRTAKDYISRLGMLKSKEILKNALK